MEETNPYRKNDPNPWGLIAGVIIAILLVGLLAQFAWNVGLVGLLAAAGIATINGISYWTALGAVALLSILRGLFFNITVTR